MWVVIDTNGRFSDQPVVFIQKIAERLEQFRQGVGPPPLLFCRPHMEALFTTLDRSGNGGLTAEQYRTGNDPLSRHCWRYIAEKFLNFAP